SNRYSAIGNDIDVIIPSKGRREYLLQVLEDLKRQTHLPRKVIVVEQNQDPKSVTDLPELNAAELPFKILHHFIHQTGACNARNIALKEVSADWIFFADDDNKMEKDLLENSLKEIKRLGADMLTFNYRQKNEKLTFDKVKQWG
ncbi:glycosyltransferase family 2 protein, partial [Salinimicrobium sp. CDJ15-91]|nr:glycosyltransferase family 2 protein [Salinimicrobium oceani]